MRAVDFNRLPPETRLRLIAAFEGKAPPYPIFKDQHSFIASTLGWSIVVLLGLGGLVGIWAAGYGSIYSFRQKPTVILGYIFAAFLAGGAVLAIIRNSLRKNRIPYPTGHYLLPLELVDATDVTLKIWPMTDLVSLQPTHHYTNGVYSYTEFALTFQGGKRQRFVMSPKLKAEQTLEYLRTVRAQVHDAIDRRDAEMLSTLDAFMSARMNDAWDRSEPAAGPQAVGLPALLRRSWLVALGAAIPFAICVYFARNWAGDRAAFSSLERYPTSYGAEAYISANGSQSAYVKENLLPKARLTESVTNATSMKSSLPIRAFLKKYPISVVSAEAQKELLNAVDTDFADAKGKETVSALRRFLADNPASSHDEEAKEAIHRLFQKTLVNFRAKASNSDPNLIPFVTELVSHLEKFDSPAVAVRFVRGSTATLLAADKVIEKSLTPAEIISGFAKASPYFDETKSKTREETLVQLIQKAFGTVFPADILTFIRDDGAAHERVARKSIAEMTADELDAEITRRKGGPYSYLRTTTDTPATDAVVPVITENSPSMSMFYSVNWSGSTYQDEKSNRLFVGIRVSFDFSMVLPNMNRAKVCPLPLGKAAEPGTLCPLVFFLDVKPPQHFSVKSSAFFDTSAYTRSGIADDGLVYEVMAARAYDELSMRLQNVFFARAVKFDDDDLPLPKPKSGNPLPPSKPVSSGVPFWGHK